MPRSLSSSRPPLPTLCTSLFSASVSLFPWSLFYTWQYIPLPWRRTWHPTPVFLPGESHRQRSLVDCSPWGRKESDTTEATQHAHTPQSSSPFLLVTTILSSISVSLCLFYLLDKYTFNDIIYCLSFSDLFHLAQCLPSPSVLLQLAKFLFEWLSSIPLSIYGHLLIDASFSIHLLIDTYLTVVSNAAVNIGVHISFQISVLVFFRHIHRSRIAKRPQRAKTILRKNRAG